MALEHVEILFLFGFMCIAMVIFEQGLRGANVPDQYKIIYFNQAWNRCLNESQLDWETAMDDKNPLISSNQGLLVCNPTNNILGYHIYRERPDNWFDMDARKCDVQSWCTESGGQVIGSNFFIWTCDGTRYAVIWAEHDHDECPLTMPKLTQQEAVGNCSQGRIMQLSKMWLCANNSSGNVTELGWINHSNIEEQASSRRR